MGWTRVALVWSLALVGADAAAQPKVIRSDADLPTERYPYDALPSATYLDDAFRDTIIPRARRDAERVLAESRIEDPAIATRLRVNLAAIALMDGRRADARRLIREARAVAPKPQTQAIGWFLQDAVSSGDCTAAARTVKETLAAADPMVVRDDVVAYNGLLQAVSPGYHAASLAIGQDGEAAAQKSLSMSAALTIARIRMEATLLPRCREALSAPIRAWLDDARTKPADIWPARAVPPAATAGAKPVTVAVWEAGYDVSIFPGQLAHDPAEPFDGRDNDRNGVVDDIFGPTYDPYLRPTARVNEPVSAALAPRLALQLTLMKGERDLGFGDDTPEARLFAQRSREATPAEQVEDALTYVEVFGLNHGTWVASLIADGAPFVRLYDFQLAPFGDDPQPIALDEEGLARWEAAMPAATTRLRGAGVRVVNMSWKSDAVEIAEKLLARGLETDTAKARARGQAMHRRVAALLQRTIRACPDILFIAGAGNSDQSDEILAAVPQSLKEPNLLVVGATGITGKPTSFTTFGRNVRLYALGEGNRVRGIGGMRMRASGTSFASPETARVAAQMLAVAPRLTPAQLIEGLTTTATREGELAVIHPANAVAWAQAKR